jgi:DNA-nicking Smr family endonuclease
MNSEKKNPDQDAFLEAMSDVTPLQAEERVAPPPKKTPPRARQLEKDDRAVLSELLNHDHDAAELESGEELLYLKPGYQKRILRRLRRGHYSVEDTIDLHHMDVRTARRVLTDFLDRAVARHIGCVRIIHGKGLRSRTLPRLKMMTNRILARHPSVIAFASSRPVAGGTGATEVLLSLRRGRTR